LQLLNLGKTIILWQMNAKLLTSQPLDDAASDKIPTELRPAYQHCRKIALNHYENFPVASILMPHKLRWHIFAVYAFARHADDLADEYNDREGLLAWRQQFHDALTGSTDNPILQALVHTINTFRIPISLFDDLLSAFLQDLQQTRYADMDELLNYCSRSANPVGRIILILNGYREESMFRQSDAICTALQLTNFWQDVKVDLQKNRIYIPKHMLAKYNIPESDLFAGNHTTAFENCLRELIEVTQQFFDEGKPLINRMHRRLKWELTLTVSGGEAILHKILKINCNVLSFRPKLSKADWVKLLFNTITKKQAS
jgi:phytoene synthase